MMLALLSAAALGQQPNPARIDPPAEGPVHAGIPIVEVQALHAETGQPPPDPAFGTARTGWSLIVPGGVVFVYVAPTSADAAAWTDLQLQRQRQPPLPVERPVAGVEAAWRRGTDFAMLRDDNIGIMVQGTEDAGEEAALVRGLIVDHGPPWPAPPTLVAEPDGTWTVQAPDALQVDWQGGHRIAGGGLRFTTPPDRLVAWDALGRAATWWREPPPADAPPPP